MSAVALQDDDSYRLLVLCASLVDGQPLDSGVLARQAQIPRGVSALYEGTVFEHSDIGLMTECRLRKALANLDDATRRVEEELLAADKAGAHFVTIRDAAYPATLKLVPSPAPFIVVRGSLRETDLRSVAVVGTRTPTEPGTLRARRLARELAENGVTVVSGLALGVDGTAHQAALASGGRTVAVLGHGIARHVYPPEHTALARQISSAGALISQFWPSDPPTKESFLARNAVCSGVAQGTAVIEASFRSGARQQARLALEQGKHLFLLRSLVENELWARSCVKREGAHIVSAVEDLLGRLAEPRQMMAAASQYARVAALRSLASSSVPY